MALPVVIDSSGLIARTPADIRTDLINRVTTTNPGYTANLPGSLVEDISSTDVAAITLCEQARVDAVNSITPYGVNESLLLQLGATYGLTLGSQTNSSVYVTFTGVQGYIIPIGFLVSDGTHQYSVQDGGAVSAGGTVTLFCRAVDFGTWAIPAGSVTTIVSSVPSPFTLTCTNANAGTPSTGQESFDDFRARVLQASMAASQGMATYLKTLLTQIPGVIPHLVSVQQGIGAWKIIVAGGDPYAIGYAIYRALFDITDLVGSTTPARNINVSLTDYPDTYQVIFVNPPQQTITLAVTWSTLSQNFISSAAVSQLVVPQLISYINGLGIGVPISLYDLQDTFRNSLSSLIPTNLISEMLFNVSINGVPTSPSGSTGLIYGDSESYMYTDSTHITLTRV